MNTSTKKYCSTSRQNNNKILVFLVVLITLCQTATTCHALQIGPLLSTCVDACQRGCIEIRKVQQERESGKNILNDNNTNKDGDVSSLGVELKDVNDPKSALTIADKAAQLAIIGALRAEWGDELSIIGEEDDDDEINAEMKKMKFEPLIKTIFDDDLGETAELDLSQVSIFVDPLDGTREFVEERLENCQVLVGIAIEGEAVAGAIGIPFPKGDLSTESTIIYGLAGVGTGVRGEILTRGPFPLERNIDGVKFPRPHHASGDSTDDVMNACRAAVIKKFGGSNVLYGGAGNKILAAALGEVSCSIQHKVGGPWDLCAPEAILKAMGGRMTDLFGEEIAIYRSDAPPRCNERGYLATGISSDVDHDVLVAVIQSLQAVKDYRKKVEDFVAASK